MDQPRPKYVYTHEEKVLMYYKQITTQSTKANALAQQILAIQEAKGPLIQQMDMIMKQCEDYQARLHEFQDRYTQTVAELNTRVQKRFQAIEKYKEQLLGKIQTEYAQIEQMYKRHQELSYQFEKLSQDNIEFSKENEVYKLTIQQAQKLLESQKEISQQLEETKKCNSQYREMAKLVKQHYYYQFASQSQRADRCAMLESQSMACALTITTLIGIEEALRRIYGE